MASLYTQQSKNIRKTWFLMTGFLVVIIALGWLLSQVYGNSYILYIAVALSLVMNISAYWFSDKIAISTAGVPKPRLYVINDAAPNAFATWRNPNNSAIAVTTGLMERLDRSELEGVIAHELSHIGNRDILVMTVAVVLAGVVAIVADIFLRMSFYGGLGGRDNKNPLILIAGVAAIVLAPLAAQLIKLAVSRKREFLADASGALLTRYPDGLASALRKISSYPAPMRRANHATAHLFIANPFGSKGEKGRFVAKLFSAHPPIEERVAALHGMRP